MNNTVKLVLGALGLGGLAWWATRPAEAAKAQPQPGDLDFVGPVRPAARPGEADFVGPTQPEPAAVGDTYDYGYGPGIDPTGQQMYEQEFVGPVPEAPFVGPVQQRQHPAPSSTATAPSDGVLRRGSRGPAVLALQQALNAQGAEPQLVEDGDYGPATEKAVLDLQVALGNVAVHGEFGPQTAAAWGYG